MIEFKFGIPIKTIDISDDIKDAVLSETSEVANKHRSGELSNPWSSNILSTFSWDTEKVNVIADECPLLKRFVYSSINEFLNELQVTPQYRMINVDESWLNYSKKGMYQEFHMHPEADISGVFYIAGDSNSGDIQFTTPSPTHAYHGLTHRSSLLRPQATYSPLPGRLLLFPSYLEHMVMANKNEEERISIALNVKLIG